LKSFINYLGCGRYAHSSNQSWGNYIVSKQKDIAEIIIPFFEKNLIEGIKRSDFQDFKQVAELMNKKVHLTKEGLDQIRKIKTGTLVGVFKTSDNFKFSGRF
jgi:hypothetical protein